MKTLKNIAKYLLFLSIGVGILWLLFRKVDSKKMIEDLKGLNYFWIVISIILGLLSQVSRAIRWKMLIKPLGYNPKVSNIFLSVLVLYFTNLIIPRAGEVARCTILGRYEHIPITKLIGTMIIERMADFLTMMFLAVFIFIANFSVLKHFFIIHPEFGQNIVEILTLTNILLGVLVIILLIALFFAVKPIKKDSKLYGFLRKLKHNFQDGIKSILKLENKWYFIGHTLFIFLMWLLMLYVVFLAFEPTSHLSIWAGMFTFLMGGLAMLMPVQGGIGAWHFIVMESLFLYGINRTDGFTFALVAHSSTSLIYIVFGIIALVLFPIVNRHYKHRHKAVD